MVLSMNSSLVVVAVALMTGACAPSWNRANRAQFQDDVEEVLAPSGVQVVLSDCRMEGTTRTGYCMLEAGLSQVEVIAFSLKMGRPQSFTGGEDPHFPAFLRDSPCVAHFLSSTPYEVIAYLIAGRPDQLQLAGGGQFEYMMIAFEPANDDACIEASYSYG
jgi:hypothetical protein